MVSHAKYVSVLGAVIPTQPGHRHSRATGSPSFPRRRITVIPAEAGIQGSRDDGSPLSRG